MLSVRRTAEQRRDEMEVEMAHLLNNFADTEFYGVLFLARRLAMGRKKYGVLTPEDGHDWTQMAVEEIADMYSYMAAHVMKIQGFRNRSDECDTADAA